MFSHYLRFPKSQALWEIAQYSYRHCRSGFQFYSHLVESNSSDCLRRQNQNWQILECRKHFCWGTEGPVLQICQHAAAVRLHCREILRRTMAAWLWSSGWSQVCLSGQVLWRCQSREVPHLLVWHRLRLVVWGSHGAVGLHCASVWSDSQRRGKTPNWLGNILQLSPYSAAE